MSISVVGHNAVVEQPVNPQDRARSLSAMSPERATSYSIRQRLASRYHAFWFRLGQGLAWSRGIYRERASGQLDQLSGVVRERIERLQQRFDVRFEESARQLTALKQYDYLDILEQAWSGMRLPRSRGGVVQDIGSSNFWYAPVLHTFFRPAELLGIEVEGHRIYLNGYSRLDYAQGYIHSLPNAQFIVGDYAYYERPADIVTAWYPFVTPDPVLAWRLPLSLFTPHALFSRIARNLQPHGRFVMINQGRMEATIAAALCRKAGLTRQGSCEVTTPLRPRRPPVLSVWGHAQK
ncbi:MAG: hypothetical protein MRJ66_12790 [Nitrospira sp.]|nr:hypothetical protein [Nitrospira sp.]